MQVAQKNMQILKSIKIHLHCIYDIYVYTYTYIDAYTMMSRTNASNEDHRLNRNHKDIQDITVWIN